MVLRIMTNTFDRKVYDISYIDRTRMFYRAQGYTSDYKWAKHSTTPIAKMSKDIADCRVGLITTAMPNTEKGRTCRDIYSVKCDPIPESMYTSELSWDKTATHTKDVGSFLPIAALKNAASEGLIGGAAPCFYTVPTDYSQRNTTKFDSPRIFEHFVQNNIDVAILVPL
ncbi:MAG: hypothetical protein CMQ02_02375 [Gammaproteobacteria bacterium]|nr:hypothetical protein [Gammaproteobacteria bacterium]